MNLSKKLLTAAFAVAAAFGLQAGTLYWQINNNPNNDQYAAVAILDAESGDLVGYANILDSDGGEVIGNLVTANDAMSEMQYAEISNDTSYKFVVEMLSTDGSTWERGWTAGTPMTYAELAAAGYVSEGGISAGSVNSWTSSVTIPEPTSGLLLLVGGSLLALRRKRRA
jgi:hypothetical protein